MHRGNPILVIKVPRDDMAWLKVNGVSHYDRACYIYKQAMLCGHIRFGWDGKDSIDFEFYDAKNLRFLRWLAMRYA